MAAIVTKLASRRTVATDVVDLEFALVSPGHLPFKAGQFVTLAVGNDETGQPLRRSYSIASLSERGNLLRFLLRIIPGGPGSDFFLKIPLGTEVAMTGPHGFFVLDSHHPGDVVFAATGTGVAPVLPMLAELGARKEGAETGRRVVYWGLRQQSDLFVPDEIERACTAVGATLHTYLSRPLEGWTGARGRITQAILHDLPTFSAPTFYLVGNGAMIDELKTELVARGIDRRKQIRTESFFD